MNTIATPVKFLNQEISYRQKEVVKFFLPSHTEHIQFRGRDHWVGINDFLDSYHSDTYLILDFDCIPLNKDIFHWMFEEARKGVLVGCAQRANTWHNGRHNYAGAFCLCFTRKLWEKIGRPSFRPSERGDTGEELTYRCEALGIPVIMLKPTHVEIEKWTLKDGTKFGYGTTYHHAIYHAFEGSNETTNESKRRFLKKCREALQDNFTPNENMVIELAK